MEIERIMLRERESDQFFEPMLDLAGLVKNPYYLKVLISLTYETLKQISSYIIQNTTHHRPNNTNNILFDCVMCCTTLSLTKSPQYTLISPLLCVLGEHCRGQKLAFILPLFQGLNRPLSPFFSQNKFKK